MLAGAHRAVSGVERHTGGYATEESSEKFNHAGILGRQEIRQGLLPLAQAPITASIPRWAYVFTLDKRGWTQSS